MSALWTIDDMAAAMRAEKSGALPADVPGLSIDSRSMAKGEAFFAIKGDNRDGHDFVEAALKAGAGLAVVARDKRAAFRRRCAAADRRRRARGLARSRARRARALARQSDRRHRLGRQDQHQGGAAAGAWRRRRDPCLRRLLQQSLGRAAVARPLSGEREIRGVRNRHEPCRRDHAAHQTGAPACGDRHRHRAGASGIFRLAEKDRRRQGGNLRRARAGRRRRAQPRQPAICAARQGRRRRPASARIVSFGENAKADARLLRHSLQAECSTVEARILGQGVTYKLGAPGKHLVLNSLAVLAAAALVGADLALGGARARQSQTRQRARRAHHACGCPAAARC